MARLYGIGGRNGSWIILHLNVCIQETLKNKDNVLNL